jgi:methanogenic corrinoid protein MtbC1
MAGLRQQVVTGGFWDSAAEEIPRNPAVLARPVTRWDGAEQRLARLVRTIESEVVPRLVLARRALPAEPAAAATTSRLPSTDEIGEFASLVLVPEIAPATSFVSALRRRGMSAETLYLDLLAPTARHLGELWDADVMSFAEVTLGLLRLHQVLHELSPTFRAEVHHGARGLRALLVPAPGEQHSFGLVMVGEFFRRAGWEVASGPVPSRQELAQRVAGERFALVGLSVSCERHLDLVATSIRAVRRASRNRAIGVMVGGPMFLENPELARLVGADATAIDGRQAVLQAQDLLDLLARGC